MGSPFKPRQQPVSLQDLLDRLGKTPIFCLGSPFPHVTTCKIEVHLDNQELVKAQKAIQDFKVVGQSHSHPQSCMDVLKNLAISCSCGGHEENGEQFAYHWLAETSLPNMLKHMGWEKDMATWTILGFDKDQECSPLKCRFEKPKRDRICSSLNKLAIGGILAEEALRDLTKHWLCKHHKAKAELLTQLLSEKLLKYMLGKGISSKTGDIGKGETLDHPDETEQKTQRKADNELIEIADSSNNTYNPVTPPNTRPPMVETSASERTARTKDTNPFLSPNNRRAASASAALGAPGIRSDDARKRKRISSSPVHESSPLRQEATSENGSINRDSEVGSPFQHAAPNDLAADMDPSSVTLGQRRSSELLYGMPNDELADNESATSEADAGAAVSGVSDEEQSVPPCSLLPSNAADQPEGTPLFPTWTRYKDVRHRHDIVTSICKLMKQNINTNTQSPKDGWIYIFSSPQFPGYVKIGLTTNEIRTRKNQIESKCKVYDLDMVKGEECFKKISWPVRLEKLIHKDLSNERRKFTCSCKKSASEHDKEENNRNQIQHAEWFAIGETRAKQVVKRWKDFMRLEIYSKDGKLREDVLRKVDKWQRHPETFGDPWCDWKAHSAFVVVHWLLSLTICISFVIWSWRLSLMLGAAFPLFSIWYDARMKPVSF